MPDNILLEAYTHLLDLNKSINILLKNFLIGDFDEFNEKLSEYINKKDEILVNLSQIKQNLKQDDSILSSEEFQEIMRKIKLFEQENLKLITEKKLLLSKEMNKSIKVSQTLSAYKFNKLDKPVIFDKKD